MILSHRNAASPSLALPPFGGGDFSVADRQSEKRRAMPRRLTLALQIGVSLALLAALIAIVDWTQLRAAAAALSLGAMVVVCLCCLCAQASLVLRWRALLDMLGVRESWPRSWHSVFAGL